MAAANDVDFSADGRYLVAAVRGGRRGGGPPGGRVGPGAARDAGSPCDRRGGGGASGVAISRDGRTVYTALPAAAYDVASGELLVEAPDA